MFGSFPLMARKAILSPSGSLRRAPHSCGKDSVYLRTLSATPLFSSLLRYHLAWFIWAISGFSRSSSSFSLLEMWFRKVSMFLFELMSSSRAITTLATASPTTSLFSSGLSTMHMGGADPLPRTMLRSSLLLWSESV